MNHFFTIYCLFWLGVFGAVFGSFLDCAAWRLAHGESILKGRSHCGSCGHLLGARDLIPFFSFLLHGGKCRYCGEKIPADCILAEGLGVVLFVGLGWKVGIGLELLMWLIFGCIALLLALVDWQMLLLPDKLLLAAAVNRVVFLFLLHQPLPETLVSMAVGACSVSVPLLFLVLAADRLLGRETMGGGDIKLLFVLGLYMDWMQMLLLLLIACIVGIGMGLCRREKKTAIPFGPALLLAWYLVLLFGDPLLAWYRSLLMI